MSDGANYVGELPIIPTWIRPQSDQSEDKRNHSNSDQANPWKLLATASGFFPNFGHPIQTYLFL